MSSGITLSSISLPQAVSIHGTFCRYIEPPVVSRQWGHWRRNEMRTDYHAIGRSKDWQKHNTV